MATVNQDPSGKPSAIIGFAPSPGSGRRLYRCTICMMVGCYGHGWSHYADMKVEDGFPSLAIFCCSSKCQDRATEKIESGEWQLPEIRQRAYNYEIKRDHKGYRAQPSQDKLREVFARQNLSQNDEMRDLEKERHE